VARRHEIFQEVAPKLNQLLCFMALVGRWKEITPTDVLSLKRDVDEVMYTNCLLFSDTLFATYHAFMARFFAMYATIDVSSVPGFIRSWRPPETSLVECIHGRYVRPRSRL
jgi:hypothetical protein